MYVSQLRQKCQSICLLLLSFVLSVLCGCDGGDIYENPPRPMYSAGFMMIEGEPMAGIPIAGDQMAGDPMAGVPMAGVPMAGIPVNEDCGLTSAPSRTVFAQAPLSLLSGSCATQGCHTSDSFREFKLGFIEPMTPEGFSPDQVIEGLNAVANFVILGQGAMSQLATRSIDNHASLGLNAQSPEYIAIVSWIDGLIPCD
jgi:hypothetical protein